MIKSFRHKRLEKLFFAGVHKGLHANHIQRLELILSRLDASDTINGMDVPSFRLHELIGDRKGQWSVTVRANWRIVFRFENGNAYDVDLVDYH